MNNYFIFITILGMQGFLWTWIVYLSKESLKLSNFF